MKKFLALLLSLSLGASPALGGPAEVPKLNPKVGSGLQAGGSLLAAPQGTTPGAPLLAPAFGSSALVVPDAVRFETAQAPAAQAQAQPRAAAQIPAGRTVLSPRISPPRRAAAESQEKSEEPAQAPAVGAEAMRRELRGMAEGAQEIQTLLDDKPAAPAIVAKAGAVSSSLFDAARRPEHGEGDATPLIPRRRAAGHGLRPAPEVKNAAAAENEIPAPAEARRAFASGLRGGVNLLMGKALYYATGGSTGVLPKTFGRNARGEPLVVLKRSAFPFSMLLPRKLRHALFGRHWLGIGVNDAPSIAEKRALIEAFRALGKEETLDSLRSGWAGGPAGFRAVTSNPALASLAQNHAADGWTVRDYREATIGERLAYWISNPFLAPTLLAKGLWAQLTGRAPPADARRIVVWTDPDPEPAHGLTLYLLTLPLRFAGAVLTEIFGDAANRDYTIRVFASIPSGIDGLLRRLLPFYRYLPEFGMTPKNLAARYNRIAFADPKNAVGIVPDREIECQTASDCAVRAVYNHPASEAVREAMNYPAFLDFAEAAVNVPLRDTGTTLERRREFMSKLGYENGDMRDIEDEEELLESLRANGPLLGRLHFTGSRIGSLLTLNWRNFSSHLVVITGAMRENGRWIYTVVDSNFKRPTRYTFRQIARMDLSVGTLKIQRSWQEGVGYRPTRPEELAATIEKAKKKFGGVRVPRNPGFWSAALRALTGGRWRALPSNEPVMVPAARRIGVEIAGRPWKGGKELEILSVADAKQRFPSLDAEASLADEAVTFVLIDPLNPAQWAPLKKDGGELWIGRTTAGRFLLSESVSRKHLSIMPVGEYFILQDHGSSNGTRVSQVRPRPVPLALQPAVQRGRQSRDSKDEIADKELGDGAFGLRRPRRGKSLLSILAGLFTPRRDGELSPEAVFADFSAVAHLRAARPVGANPGGGVGFGRIGGKPYYFKMPLANAGPKFTPALIAHEALVAQSAYSVFERGLFPDNVEAARSVKRRVRLRATGRYGGIELGRARGELVEAEALVSEPAPGMTLDEFHTGGGRLSSPEIESLRRAVSALHGEGVAHGDLSGANLAVLDDPRNWSRRVLTLFDFDLGALAGDPAFERAKAADLNWLARLDADYGGDEAAAPALFDNRMRGKAEITRVLGYDPSLEEGEVMSSPHKGSTHVKEIRPPGPRRVVKWFQEAAQAADELFMRRVFKRFTAFSDFFETADALGYRHGLTGGATLVMTRAPAEADGRRFTALPTALRLSLALTQVFGMSDFNPGSMLFPSSGKPVVIDFEKLGPVSPQTGRIPMGLILAEMPWVPTRHFTRYEEYAPGVEAWRAQFTPPETQKEMLTLLTESGHSPRAARARLALFNKNLAGLEAVLRADIDLANQYVLQEGLRAGLSETQTRAWSDLNGRILDRPEGANLRNFIRSVNSYFLSLEDEGTRWLAGRAQGPALEAQEFAYYLTKTGGRADEALLARLAREIEVPGIDGLRRLAGQVNAALDAPSQAPAIPPAHTFALGAGR